MAELILAPTAFVQPSSLTLAGGGTNPLGVFATVTATATTGAGAPAPGVTVTFAILSGPDAGAITCLETGGNTNTTDAAGQARCTYKDTTVVGTDNVQASIGLLTSNIVNLIWILAAISSLDIPTLSEWGLLIMAGAAGGLEPVDAPSPEGSHRLSFSSTLIHALHGRPQRPPVLLPCRSARERG